LEKLSYLLQISQRLTEKSFRGSQFRILISNVLSSGCPLTNEIAMGTINMQSVLSLENVGGDESIQIERTGFSWGTLILEGQVIRTTQEKSFRG
jgi:hypothetical protein